MAKKKKRIETKRARVLRITRAQRGSRLRRIEKKKTIKKYNHLLRDFIDKQIQLGVYKKGQKNIRRDASSSKQMKQLLKDLATDDPFLKKKALKQTTRRDGVPDFIAVGETPTAYTMEAA